MKFLWVLLFSAIMIGADELDFLDEIDSDVATFEEKESSVDIRAKLSFQKNKESEDDKIFYLNLAKQEKNYQFDIRIVADEDTQNINIKELYYKGNFADNSFYEIGRINIKEGISRGFNPTDYFKGSHSLTQSSDPKERKDNRLGALLFSETMFLDKFTLKAIYSPKISVGKNNLFGDTKYIGLHLDETNYVDRGTLFVDYNKFKDVSSSMILHLNEDDLNFGINVSYVYQDWIFYLENSLKRSKNNINKVIDKMQLHPDVVAAFSEDKLYIDQATVGFNYTSDSNIITTLEYIYNGGGLDSDGWDDWFSLSEIHPQVGAIRSGILENEALLSRHSLFLLSRASDIKTNLDATALAWINPYDGSTLSQIGLEYAYDDLQTNIFLKNYRGKENSEYGSSQNDYELLIEAEYFF